MDYVCIIKEMPPKDRSSQMSLRLSASEARIRDALATHFGIDGSGVLRMGLLELARKEGITIPETKKSPEPKPRNASR